MSRLARFVTADGLSAVLPVPDESPVYRRAIYYHPPRRIIDWLSPGDALSVSVPVRTYEYYGTEHDPERGELLVYRERYGGSR